MAERANTYVIQAEKLFEARSSERFDRVAYALELLKVLNPPLTVAVYGTRRHLQVQRGRLSSKGPWALFGVPPHATRESIAHAVAELSDRERTPFLVDLLSATR
ncbi:MAG TPA: hypothetical protein VGM44_07755 [Polyangiaceae bacterium]|jgi:hypothetical protein